MNPPAIPKDATGVGSVLSWPQAVDLGESRGLRTEADETR